jgi:hypothetical protein
MKFPEREADHSLLCSSDLLDAQTSPFVPYAFTVCCLSGYSIVRVEVFTAVTMKNVVFWDVTPCASYKSRYFGRTYRLRHQGGEIQRAKNNVISNQ